MTVLKMVMYLRMHYLFGFRGLPVIKTTNSLTDNMDTLLAGPGSSLGSLRGARLGICSGSRGTGDLLRSVIANLTSSILPPLPLTFKATRGAIKASASPAFIGEPGLYELSDARMYWGVKFQRLPVTASVSNAVLQSNASSSPNELISSYSKMLGISKLDTLVTGSGADYFNDNKFTLARVGLYNTIKSGQTLDTAVTTQITGTAADHMREAAYLRDKDPNPTNYSLTSTTITGDRLSLASLYAITSSVYFNKFIDYNKFTNMMFGGFDGNNILDKDMRLMNDRAASSDAGGKASGGVISRKNLNSSFTPGTGKNNNTVAAYRTAGKILTDPLASRVNIVTVPGMRDSFITDYIADRTKDYNQAFYIMDIPHYSTTARIYDDTSLVPNVSKTAEEFSGRNIDNSYAGAYFPDVSISDPVSGKASKVPASVVVLGALGYNDAVAYPWFAPAGFNRGALDAVVNTTVRLTTANRDELYENRINPIANFPNGGFVIFGQKTLQQAQSALDRVNVRRMLIEVKRLVSDVANKIVFEQNTPRTRSKFVAQVTPLLAVIQSQQGIDQFKVVMDSSNNSSEDMESNRLNGRIILVPTRAVEFIAIDFIITNAGVSFD